MKTLNASDFKAKCLAILDMVRDTGESVLILKRGRPVARLVPPVVSDSPFPQADLKGTVRTLGDVIAPVVPEADWETLSESE